MGMEESEEEKKEEREKKASGNTVEGEHISWRKQGMLPRIDPALPVTSYNV